MPGNSISQTFFFAICVLLGWPMGGTRVRSGWQKIESLFYGSSYRQLIGPWQTVGVRFILRIHDSFLESATSMLQKTENLDG